MGESSFNKDRIWEVLKCTIYSEMMVAGATDESTIQRLIIYDDNHSEILLEWLNHWKTLSKREKEEEAKEWRRRLNEKNKESEELLQTHILKFHALGPNVDIDEHFHSLLDNVEVFKKMEKYIFIEDLENGTIKEALFREFLLDQNMPNVLAWLDEWVALRRKYCDETTLEMLKMQDDYQKKHQERQDKWEKDYNKSKKCMTEYQYVIWKLFEPKIMEEVSIELFQLISFHLRHIKI